MKATEAAAVRVETHGKVPNRSADLAAAKVSSLLVAVAEPVLSARVTLAVAADLAVERPAIAQATIDVNGRIMRAQAAGQTVRAAIELMAARLRVRLGHAARSWAALRGTMPVEQPGEWQHQSIPARRPPYFPRPGDQREVICSTSYAAGDAGRGLRRAGPAGLRLPPVHRAVDRTGQRESLARGSPAAMGVR